MPKHLKILMLEDHHSDAELIQKVILKGKLECEFNLVSDKIAFKRALETFNPDIILSDNQLPQFDATQALEMTRKHSLHLPFILVTGTVSEEFAANVMRMGADDYILKDRLARLPVAILASIDRRKAEAIVISERKKTEQEILQMNEQLRHLSNHLQNIREEEGTRIAREIHDQLGQQLTVMKMDVSWINKRAKDKDAELQEKAEEILKMIDETIKTVRKISADLRPSLLDNMGLGPAIESYLEEFGKRSGLRTQTIRTKNDILLPEFIKIGLYRVVQEALTNISRHAHAENVTVSIIENDNNVVISVEDDGNGFDPKEIVSKNTLGILGMRERVKMMNGSYEINSLPGKGTIVNILIPLAPNSN